MKRISLTDRCGSWFDADSAQLFEEETHHNGNNWISSATGSQWHHENLYLTASGKWILNTWSNYQGTRSTYEEITELEAARWFGKQNYPGDNIPESLKQGVNELEI